MTIKVQEHKKFICLLLTALLIGSLCCGCGTSKEVMAESVADIDADSGKRHKRRYRECSTR